MFRRVIAGPNLALPDDHGDKSSRRYLCVSGLERLSDDDFVGRDIGASVAPIAIKNDEITALASVANEPVVKVSPVRGI